MATASSKDLRQLAEDVNLCRHNIFPSRCAADCKRLHLCRLFAADMCPYAKRCRSGHNLHSSHNLNVLKERGLEQLSGEELLNAVKVGYLARYPITDTERRSALQLCRAYLYDEDGCEDEDCPRLHVCDEYVAETCSDDSGCELSHQIYTSSNSANIRRVGLNHLAHSELKEALNEPPTAKDICQSLSAQDVDLCRHNIHPSRCGGNCRQLHLCRLFVADMCPYDEMCRSGHNIHSSHNFSVLKERGLWRLSEEELLEEIETGYLARNPITDLERCFSLQICHAYLYDEDGCEDEDCLRLHVCDEYVAGTCSDDGGCELSHQIYTSSNSANIRRVGLNHLRHGELLQILRDSPTAKDVWQGLLPNNQAAATSRASSPPMPRNMDNNGFGAFHQSTSESSVGPFQYLKESAQDINVCRYNIYPFSCAGGCGQLHLCRLFVAGMCPYEEVCKSGHNVHSSHNFNVLRERGLWQLSEEDILEAMEVGYLARSPITDMDRMEERWTRACCD